MSTMFRKWPVVLVAAAIGVLPACTDEGLDPDPSPSTGGTSSAGKSMSAVPTVEKPIDLGDLWTKPCSMIEAFDLEDFGFRDVPGQADVSGATAGCRWSAQAGARMEIVAYPNSDILGATYGSSSAKTETFMPTTTLGFPAVYLTENAKTCTLVVGFSVRQGIKVTYVRGEPFKDEGVDVRCQFPRRAAMGVVEMIRHPP